MSKSPRFVAVLCAVLAIADSHARQFPSTAQDLEVLSARMGESTQCVQASMAGAAKKQSNFAFVVVGAIADLPVSAQVIADAHALSQAPGEVPETTEATGKFEATSLAVASLLTLGSDQTIDPWIRYGALSSLLLASIAATKGDCPVPEELTMARASALAIASGAEGTITIAGERVDEPAPDQCDAGGFLVHALEDGRYRVEDSVLSHVELVSLLEAKRDADSSFSCVEIVSAGDEIDIRRAISFPKLGLQIDWRKP